MRPYLSEFLSELGKMGKVVLFTSAEKEYADPIVNKIDPKNIIQNRYYREVTRFILKYDF